MNKQQKPKKTLLHPYRISAIDLTEYESRCLDETKKILGPITIARIVGMAIRQFRLSPSITALRAGTMQEVGIDLLEISESSSSDPNEEQNSLSSSPSEQSLTTTGQLSGR